MNEDAARKFAEAAHREQRYGEHPYVVHLYSVRQVLRDFGYTTDSSMGIASWLHDVLEDTPTDIKELDSRFGRQVSDLVWAVTGVGVNRKARVADAYRKIAAFPAAVPLKLADRIANAESSELTNPSLHQMYKREYAGFKSALFHLLDMPAMWERLDRSLKDSK